jgi:DNA gyrase subunit A
MSLSLFKLCNVNGKRAITLLEDDELTAAILTDGNAEIITATRNGRVLRTSESAIRASGRGSRGVRLMKFKGDDEIVGAAVAKDDCALLTVTEKGYGKRTRISDYPLKRRGGLGIFGCRIREEKGLVCGIRVVNEDEDIIMISTNGIVIRIRACDISICGRYATGVRLMKLSGDACVATFTPTEHDDEAEIEEVETATEEELDDTALEELEELEKLEASEVDDEMESEVDDEE